MHAAQCMLYSMYVLYCTAHKPYMHMISPIYRRKAWIFNTYGVGVQHITRKSVVAAASDLGVNLKLKLNLDLVNILHIHAYTHPHEHLHICTYTCTCIYAYVGYIPRQTMAARQVPTSYRVELNQVLFHCLFLCNFLKRDTSLGCFISLQLIVNLLLSSCRIVRLFYTESGQVTNYLQQ